MSVPRITTSSFRATRMYARIPRILAAVLVCMLSATGLRMILAGPPQPAPVRTISAPSGDQGATSFAEAFARAYLTWDAENPDAREQALAPFMVSELDEDGGVEPAPGDSQTVRWTAVLGDRRDGSRRLVTVMAQTSKGSKYVSVPVARDQRGFLAIVGYPALVGPPAVAKDQDQPSQDEVEDGELETIVSRALSNYLAVNQRNLLADLAPDAVVSLPAEALKVNRVREVTWVHPGRRVAADVEAQDERGTTWTLRYELDVLKRDRWYVRSLQVNPTFQGGS